jgi:DNA replication licensing factor MCM5
MPGILWLQHKATHVTIICQKCKNTKVIACKPGLGGAQIPRYCDGATENEFGDNQNCGQDSFVILPHKSKFADIQTLKLQVCPETRQPHWPLFLLMLI